mgnify:CR=1 FL=1
MDKIGYFKEELSYILNPKIREFAEKAVDSLPDYFFMIPASSTMRYHPAYALTDGGLLKHTKAAIRIAVELFRTDLWKFTEDEKDLIIAGIMVHDGFKSGVIKEKYTRADHPNIVVSELSKNEELHSLIPEDQFNFFCENIKSHMGKWNMTFDTKQEILEKPKSTAQRFFHLCDYLASRKCLEFNFDIPVSRNE